MLHAHEIPREEWPAFFRVFADQHQGHVCSLGIITQGQDRALNLHSLRLAALDAGASGGDELCVLVSDLAGAKLAHIITAPRHVYLHGPDADVVETLEIDGAGGRTVMRFEPPS